MRVLALAFCLAVVAPRSPTSYINLIAAIVLAFIADFVARTRTEPGSRTNPEVFLSFRGRDTRKGFTDHLYSRLIDARINVFKDDEDLPPGDKVDDALLESIKQSKVSIPIISKDYASSRSCLMELAQMLECEKENNQLIVPIFYDISPRHLRNQCGGVGESLHEHENRGVGRKDIAIWKQALREIAERKGGLDLPSTKDGHQGELVNTVVSYILRLLKKDDLLVTGSLVGIEPHVQEVMRKFGVVYVNEVAMAVCDSDVRVLGICSMPGIGKTTVAKFVYNNLRHLFQGCSFLLVIQHNLKSHRLMGLQEQLISDLQKQERRRLSTPDEGTKVIANSFSDMKVLILLDDVCDFGQIEHLVGNLSWFGLGSRILMTVRRKDVLDAYRDGVADEYEIEPMRPFQALQLFCKHAFHGCPPEEEYEYEYDCLSIDFIDIIGGLPLAIEVIASHLCKIGWHIEIWREQLHRLRSKLDDKVKLAFWVSYDSLDEETREIFIDIACFFNGMDERIPSYMWRASDYYPSRGIKFLRDMCLIKIGKNNELWMHDQLRKFGREIVMMENPRKPQKRSRLWSDALSTLNGEESAKKVEALCLTFDEGQSGCFRCERFGHLRHLRFLRLDQATIEGTSQNVLPNLRWLDWQGCSEISELLIFHLEKLVILDLSYSLVTGESQEWGQILEKAKGLKVLILCGCHRLDATPYFHSSMSLEILVLECCPPSFRVSPSISNLKNLVSLNLRFCRSVEHLPEQLCDMKILEELLIDGTSIRIIDFRPASMKRLKTLSACQCESLVWISDSIGQLESLVHLRLDGAGIDSLPDSVGSLKRLQTLLLGNCRKLAELPYSIGNLESLEFLDLSSTHDCQIT